MDFEIIKTKVREASKEGILSCSTAFQLAEELGCDPMEIGRAADELKIKIMHCRLGCF
ncbi:MAG: hypothetical protein WAO23_06205 [Dethiobacteria bacterium]